MAWNYKTKFCWCVWNLVFIFVFLILTPTSVSAQTPITALGVPYSASIAHQLSNYYANWYKVSPALMWRIVECEDGSLNPAQQSNFFSAGKRERSFGLVQIHLPSWPSISYDQAIDPDFSLQFMAKEIAAGHASYWTCYTI